MSHAPEEDRELAPQPADKVVPGTTQTVAADSSVPSEEKRGGALTATNMPDAIEGIVVENIDGLTSDAGVRLLLAWIREQQHRFAAVVRAHQETMEAFTSSQKKIGEEREKRIVADERLASHEKFGPLTKVTLVAGTALFGLGIDHIDQPVGFSLALIGAVLIVVAAFGHRIKL